MTRTVIRIALQVSIATALTVLLAWVYFVVILGEPPARALDQVIRDVLIFVDIGIATWLVLLIVAAVRKRGIGWGIGGAILAALIGIVVNLVWIVILSVINGGVDIAAIALGVQAGILFLIAVIITVIFVQRVILPPVRA